jgi:hypothetical protein
MKLPNETVEKPYFAGRNTRPELNKPLFGAECAWGRAYPSAWGLLERPKSLDFPDIVHQGKQSPLYIHLGF